MTALQAVILGIVQGATEFLPISSTAHLKIVPVLLGWPDPGAAFSAVTQWGTWVATVIYFRHDISRLLVAWWRGLTSGRPFAEQDSRLAWMIAFATVPIVVAGLMLKKYVDREFRYTVVIAVALIGLALLLFAAEWLAAWRRKRGFAEKDLQHVGWGDAMLIGFAQAVALVPGASRSGVTITGALFMGLDRPTAARFSFLLSLPAIFGAGLYQLYKEWNQLMGSRADALNLLIATVVAGVIGYGVIALLLRYLKTHSTAVFILYRIALGIVLLALLYRGLVPSEDEEKAPAREQAAATARR
jgi:undecaprenyl-diphosphatase